MFARRSLRLLKEDRHDNGLDAYTARYECPGAPGAPPGHTQWQPGEFIGHKGQTLSLGRNVLPISRMTYSHVRRIVIT